MKNIFFIGYDAIGDYISYNGMIRSLSEYYDKVTVVTNYGDFVRLSFRDNDKITNISYNSYYELINKDEYFDIIDARVWEDYGKPPIKGNYYDRNNKFGDLCEQVVNDNASSFYSILGFPISNRINKYYLQRLDEQENNLMNKHHLINTEYSVICEYGINNINRKYVEKENIVNLHMISNDMLDIVKIVENANDIHLIENSVALLIYHLQSKNLMKKVNVNLHAYSRKDVPYRVCNGDDKNNFYINMLLSPRLENWNIIWHE
jgi:hypothetical protein